MDPTSRTTTGTDAGERRRRFTGDVRHYDARERLLDGRPVRIRAIRPEDREGIREGFHRLSERSVYRRFFQVKRELSEQELTYLTEVDFETHVALLAMVPVDKDGGAERGVGVGRYIIDPQTGVAEIAFAVDDEHQGLGIGTLLLTHLARIARGKGLREFRAYVLLENRPMIEVFEHAGFPIHASGQRREGNAIVLTLGLE